MKCWNISVMSVSHSRSSMTTHDLTLATVSRIITLLLYDLLDLSFKFSKDDTINWKTSCINHRKCYWRADIWKNNEKATSHTFIFSSSYGASGAVILVISLIQEATATFTSTSECLKRSFATNAFINGESASCIDFPGDCSTFDRKDSACLKERKHQKY